MNTIGEFDFGVRSYECGPDGVAKLSSVMDYMQEAASLQAAQCGFSRSDFDAAGENVSWIITRMHVRMTRYPRWRETVHVKTWPCGGRKIVAERDFELSVGGETVGVGTSEWMLIDLATRKIVPVPQRVYDRANDERPRAMPGHVFGRMRWDCRAAAPDAVRLRATHGDIDLNGHVNNVRYVSWLLEALPAGSGLVRDLEITYKSETLAGDEILAETAEVEPGVFAAHLAASDGRDHVVARIQMV